MRPLHRTLALAAPVFGAAPAFEEPGQFPDAPGREETFYACVACHNFKLVAAQGLTRERWAETLAMMSQRHAIQPLDGEDEAVVLDYLAAAFGPKAPGGAAGWRNPFAGN